MITWFFRTVVKIFKKYIIGNPSSFKLILIDMDYVKFEHLELFNFYRRKYGMPCVLIPVHHLGKPIEVIDLDYNISFP